MDLEADARDGDAAAHDVFEPLEGAAAHEEDLARVDGDELLMWMLPAPLRWDGGERALDHLQERLLHAFPRHVAGDRCALGLAGDLVDLVDVDDALLGARDVVVGHL